MELTLKFATPFLGNKICFLETLCILLEYYQFFIFTVTEETAQLGILRSRRNK